jgi:hypothetical protein
MEHVKHADEYQTCAQYQDHLSCSNPLLRIKAYCLVEVQLILGLQTHST